MLFSQLPILRSNKMLLGRIMLHLSRIYIFFCSATCQICPSCRAKDARAKRGKRPGHLSVDSPSLLLWLSLSAPPAPPPAHCQPTYCSNALAIFVKFPGLGLGHLEIKAMANGHGHDSVHRCFETKSRGRGSKPALPACRTSAVATPSEISAKILLTKTYLASVLGHFSPWWLFQDLEMGIYGSNVMDVDILSKFSLQSKAVASQKCSLDWNTHL